MRAAPRIPKSEGWRTPPPQANDEVFTRHLVHVLHGAVDNHGPEVAALIERIIRKAQKEYGITTAGYIARLMVEDARAQGWLGPEEAA
jgi:hypothetical protein